MIILKTDALTKRYRNITAADRLNISIDSGMIFGLLGPNGSGKSTTLGMLLGVIQPTSGTYSWFEQGSSHVLRRRIGAILEQPIFYPHLSGIKNLQIAAEIKNVSHPDYEGVLDKVGLLGRHNDSFKQYSLGMKQRLAIGSALLADPEVLIFDEPTNGLDPQGIAEIRAIIKSIAAEDKTIILASHLLDEVQKVCTDFMVMRKGKHIYTGSVEEALNSKRSFIVGSDQNQRAAELLASFGSIQEHNNGIEVVPFSEQTEMIDISRRLAEATIYPTHLVTRKTSLEEQFLAILSEHE